MNSGLNMKKQIRRIENKSSSTAGFNCMYRAASYLEKNKFYRSEDYIALRLLPGIVHFLVKYRIVNFQWSFFPKGIYEYVIARTKYIDEQFKELMKNGIEQIVILGAGFDTRGIRFSKINSKTRIFELDSFHTQKAKICQFKKRGILSPVNTIYVPIDFSVDSMSEKLVQKEFDSKKRTFFLMEGLVMYLDKKAVNNLFRLVYKLASPGSRVIFDYIYASVLRRENIYYGEENIYKKVNSVQESWLFGIEKGEIKEFLQKYNFKLIQNLTSEGLEKMFFKDNLGNITGKVNGTHCIAYIEK